MCLFVILLKIIIKSRKKHPWVIREMLKIILKVYINFFLSPTIWHFICRSEYANNDGTLFFTVNSHQTVQTVTILTRPHTFRTKKKSTFCRKYVIRTHRFCVVYTHFQWSVNNWHHIWLYFIWVHLTLSFCAI